MPLRYLSTDELLADSQQLALAILDSGYRPDLLIALWRGGTPIAIAIHEVFALAGLDCRHAALGASSYTGIDQQHAVQFTGLETLPTLAAGRQRLLLVDDVFDTGRTLQTLIHELTRLLPAPLPSFRIAAPWYKPQRNQTSLVPDYHLHTTDDWLVFPHELLDLDEQQLLAKPGRAAILQRLAALRRRGS